MLKNYSSTFRQSDRLTPNESPVTFKSHVWETNSCADREQDLKLCFDSMMITLESGRNFPIYAMVSHSCFQNNNRITVHNGLWKSLLKLNPSLKLNKNLTESISFSEHGMIGYGFCQIESNNVALLFELRKITQCCFLTGQVNLDIVTTLIKHGWGLPANREFPPLQILTTAFDQSLIAGAFFGNFDDATCGVSVSSGEIEILPRN
jgi:hypothetical protein